MSSTPSPTDLLCESCGYTLNGLPETGNCPECGTPIVQSTRDDNRRPAPFEVAPSASTFAKTTALILLSPRKFYRGLTVRNPSPQAARFSLLHRLLTGKLLIAVLLIHLQITGTLSGIVVGPSVLFHFVVAIAIAALVVPSLKWVSLLAAKLASVEANWWGMRLPFASVRRAIDFHAASYVVVAIGANIVVVGYLLAVLSGYTDLTSLPAYLYTIAGYVVVSAAYLFWMFVTAMRAIRYANR
jgi:hypothetical protein